MKWWFQRRSEPAPPEAARPMAISRTTVSAIGSSRRFELTPLNGVPVIEDPFQPCAPPPGSDAPELAFDDAFSSELLSRDFHEGIGFLGYAFLAELAQRPEYRKMSETLAREMTREWLQLVSTGDEDSGASFAARAKEIKKQHLETDPSDKEARDDLKAQWADLLNEQYAESNPKADKLKAIRAELRRLKAPDAFRRAAQLDGFFGRGQIYIDTGHTDKPDELATPLVVDKRKVRKGALKRLVVVEPAWSYPADYNSSNPLKPTYYRPQSWYVMATKVHHSRLLTFVGREMPDMLKPAYAFSGLSLSQMAKPYVDNWLRTRQSVSDLVSNYSVFGIKTDLSSALNGGDAEQLIARADMFNRGRDNRGLFILQKSNGPEDPGEEFFNVTVPLTGLDKLQAQAQEQMASVSGIPLVILLGITPSGLNASSDGEIRVFYDFIAAFQEQLFGSNMDLLLRLVQLSLFGEVDPEIGYEFEPLWQLDETALAASRKADADIDCEYVDRGILSTKEVRGKIAADRKGPYASLDVDDVPEAPEGDEGEETDPTKDADQEGGDAE